jgi:actin-related protein
MGMGGWRFLTILTDFKNKQAVLALYAAKRISGIVVNIGFNVTSIVPGIFLSLSNTQTDMHMHIHEQNIMVKLDFERIVNYWVN